MREGLERTENQRLGLGRGLEAGLGPLMVMVSVVPVARQNWTENPGHHLHKKAEEGGGQGDGVPDPPGLPNPGWYAQAPSLHLPRLGTGSPFAGREKAKSTCRAADSSPGRPTKTGKPEIRGQTLCVTRRIAVVAWSNGVQEAQGLAPVDRWMMEAAVPRQKGGLEAQMGVWRVVQEVAMMVLSLYRWCKRPRGWRALLLA